MDADVGQASQNRTKIITKNLKSWDFKTIGNFKNGVKAFGAEFINLSPIKVSEGEPIDDENTPVAIRLLNRWSIFFASQDFIEWYSFHSKEHKHLLISIVHKLGACFAKIVAACSDWQTVAAAEKGQFPGEDSPLREAYANMIREETKIKDCVANGIVGEFGHASMLYHIVCPQPKVKKEDDKKSNKRKGRDKENDKNGPARGGNNRNCMKIFALKNGNESINFSELGCPKIKVGNKRAGYLCCPGHLEGKECARESCRFIHLGKDYDENITTESMTKLVNWLSKCEKLKKGKDWIEPKTADNDAGNDG